MADSFKGENILTKRKKDDDDGDDFPAKKKKILYKKSPLAEFKFKNGEVIRVNKVALALQCEYFHDVLFGILPQGTSVDFEIKDHDRESFQTFLDCLFGLKKYTVKNSLKIFPIAHKYGVENCLEKCISALKPTVMNGSVCRSLNFAVFSDCEELVTDIVAFFMNKVGIVNVLENKNYRAILMPETVSLLLEYINLDSYIWTAVYKYGIDYMENQLLKGKDIRWFFVENDFLKKLSLSDFESVQSIFDFHKLTEKELLNTDEIFDHLEKNIKKLPVKSCWIKVEKEEEITETVIFKNSVVVSSEDLKNGFSIRISKNRVCPKIFKYSYNVNCKVRVVFKNIRTKKDEVGAPDFFRCSTFSEVVAFIGNNTELVTLNRANAVPDCCGFIYENVKDFDGVKDISFPIDLPGSSSEIKSVEITYTFPFCCRLLKTPISENFIHGEELYFTSDVVYSKSKT